jgi:hypothetical protein
LRLGTDTWTSADAARLAILPGLVRYDEVFGPDEIRHAFRVTVRSSNSFYVWPASHRTGSNSAASPFGARLRLKASKNLSGFRPEVQKVFRAMQRYGLIVADNGSDMCRDQVSTKCKWAGEQEIRRNLLLTCPTRPTTNLSPAHPSGDPSRP